MQFTYRNPVWGGYFADPFVLKLESGYWAYGTGRGGDGGNESDGRVFPILRSPDLVHWESVGGAVNPLNDPTKPAYWAPEVARRRDETLHVHRFYLYYSAGGHQGEGHQLRVAISDRPQGPFEDCGILLPDEPFSIDAHPFRDPADGRWYLFFAKDFFDDPVGTGVVVAPLDDSMSALAGYPRSVVRASADWQVFERNRFWYNRVWPVWHTCEGPSVVFHEGKYYCFYSGGRWDAEEYGVSFTVADSPLGPYRETSSVDGPSVLRGIPDKVLGPGHNSITVGPEGETEFIVYHAWDPERTARRMFIDPLVWTPQGPRCEGPTYSEQVIQA